MIEARESQPTEETLPPETSQHLNDIYVELVQYSNNARQQHSVLKETQPPPHRCDLEFSLFLPRAFSTPDSAIYALKLTLSAMICYTIYSAIAWPSILTCVVTVLFTGLSSTGAMKQKQLYRISGAAIGGFLGIATESLLFPNMDSITSLMIIVRLVSLLAAWIMRSPHASYLGIQIGFAFFLTALPGFSAVTQISPARDRVLGVTLGILVMWFIFDQLWPTRTSDVFHKMLERIHRATITLREPVTKRNNLSVSELSSMRIEVSRELAKLQMLETSAYFDFGRSHSRELAKCRRLSRRVESSAGEFYTEMHRYIERVDLG